MLGENCSALIVQNRGFSNMDKNALHYACWIIEKLSRVTGNPKKIVVDGFGESGLKYLLEFYDILHCENQDKIIDELLEDYNLGQLQPLNNDADLPSVGNIAGTYKRLIEDCYPDDFVGGLSEVFHSTLAEYIDDYRLPVYFASSSYLAKSYKAGELL